MRREFAAIAIAVGISIFLKLTGVTVVEGEVQELGHIRVGSVASDGDLTALSGEKISIATLRGQAVLIVFTATWCGACRTMLRPLRDLSASAALMPATVIAVDVRESEEVMKEYYSHRRIGEVRVTADPSGALAERFGVTAFPTLFILDRYGVVRFIRVGALVQLDAVNKALDAAARP